MEHLNYIEQVPIITSDMLQSKLLDKTFYEINEIKSLRIYNTKDNIIKEIINCYIGETKRDIKEVCLSKIDDISMFYKDKSTGKKEYLKCLFIHEQSCNNVYNLFGDVEDILAKSPPFNYSQISSKKSYMFQIIEKIQDTNIELYEEIKSINLIKFYTGFETDRNVFEREYSEFLLVSFDENYDLRPFIKAFETIYI